MTEFCDPLAGSVVTHLLQDAAHSLCDRPGASAAQRDSRTRDMIHKTAGFRPRDGLEYMLSTLMIGHYEMIMDSMRDVLAQGQFDTMRARTKSTIVAMDRSMLGLLKELRSAQKRPLAQWAIDGLRATEAEAAVASVSASTRTEPAEPGRETPADARVTPGTARATVPERAQTPTVRTASAQTAAAPTASAPTAGAQIAAAQIAPAKTATVTTAAAQTTPVPKTASPTATATTAPAPTAAVQTARAQSTFANTGPGYATSTNTGPANPAPNQTPQHAVGQASAIASATGATPPISHPATAPPYEAIDSIPEHFAAFQAALTAMEATLNEARAEDDARPESVPANEAVAIT